MGFGDLRALEQKMSSISTKPKVQPITSKSLSGQLLSSIKPPSTKPMVYAQTKPQVPTVTTMSKNTPSIIQSKILPEPTKPKIQPSGDWYAINGVARPGSTTPTSTSTVVPGGSGGTTNKSSGGGGSGSTSSGGGGGASAVTANENYKPDYNTQVAQPTAPPTQEQPPIDITPYFAQVGAIMNQVNDQGKALLAQLNASFINELNSMQSQIEDAFKRMLGGVDPATEQTLARIKGTVETQRQNLMNEMNRRGLLQSGIWLEMENRLNQNQLSEEQALLLNRVKALQDQYLAQLWNFAQARLNYMSEYNKNAMGQWNTYAQGIQNQLKNSMDAATEIYRQQQQNYRTGLEQQGANYRAELPYQYPTANAMLPYELGPTPYQQEQLKIDRQNANTNAARVNAPDTPTQTQIANYYIASAINKMNEFSTLQEKNDWLYAHKAEIIANAGPSAYQYLLEQLYPSYR